MKSPPPFQFLLYNESFDFFFFLIKDQMDKQRRFIFHSLYWQSLSLYIYIIVWIYKKFNSDVSW